MSAPDDRRAPDVPADAPLLTVLCTMVRFPVPRWCLVAAAHDRGLDVVTVDRLLRLPPVVESPEALRILLARSAAQRSSVPPAVPPAASPTAAPAAPPRPGISARPAPRPSPR